MDFKDFILDLQCNVVVLLILMCILLDSSLSVWISTMPNGSETGFVVAKGKLSGHVDDWLFEFHVMSAWQLDGTYSVATCCLFLSTSHLLRLNRPLLLAVCLEIVEFRVNFKSA